MHGIIPGMDPYEPFTLDYDRWASDMTEDVQWYVSLAREAGEPVVELAVGSGRVAIPIARETGKRVLGIDRSGAMLAIARERAAGLPIELREGDIRELSLAEPVELVICPFRSLMHLPTWADKRRVFERVAASLIRGGRFAWNVFAFSPRIAAQQIDQRVDKGDGLWEEVHYRAGDSRIELVRGRGDDVLGTLHIWWSTRAEWEGLIDVAGLETEALYGGFHREPYTDESLEMTWVARKP
jgi:SAM-dependent methyltransferase